MKQIELRQLCDHSFDLEMRDGEESNEDIMAEYTNLITEEGVDHIRDEVRPKFEKAISGLIEYSHGRNGMLIELGVERVCPKDATEILERGVIPSEAIQQLVDEIRPKFEEAVMDYANQLTDSGITFNGPVSEQLPSQSEQGEYNEILARFVILSILGDQRENG